MIYTRSRRKQKKIRNILLIVVLILGTVLLHQLNQPSSKGDDLEGELEGKKGGNQKEEESNGKLVSEGVVLESEGMDRGEGLGKGLGEGLEEELKEGLEEKGRIGRGVDLSGEGGVVLGAGGLGSSKRRSLEEVGLELEKEEMKSGKKAREIRKQRKKQRKKMEKKEEKKEGIEQKRKEIMTENNIIHKKIEESKKLLAIGQYESGVERIREALSYGEPKPSKDQQEEIERLDQKYGQKYIEKRLKISEDILEEVGLKEGLNSLKEIRRWKFPRLKDKQDQSLRKLIERWEKVLREKTKG